MVAIIKLYRLSESYGISAVVYADALYVAGSPG